MKELDFCVRTFIKHHCTLFFALLFFCAVSSQAQTYTIDFSAHPPPPTNDPSVDQNDQPPFGSAPGNAIETGVRFRVTQPGFVTGIRFYKGNGTAGVHIGHLWSNDGSAKLAEATFTETANGWQEVAINVHISAGVKYVASVYDDIGDYAAEPTGSYNWSTPGTPPNDFGSPPIMVIRASNDPGGNGIYSYLTSGPGFTGSFPNTASPSAANYWIDIRFAPDFPLPVSLSDFKATPANSDVALTWTTDHEYYNRGFEIQRSNNSLDWLPVGFVDGVMQSDVARNYSYTDKGLAPGSYYYRLKQTDLDGKNTFSTIVRATIEGKGKISLFPNYPNPFRGSTTIRFDLPQTQRARLTVVDLTGREVKVLVDRLSEAGSHVITFDAGNLKPQIYILTLRTDAGVLTEKISVR